MHVAVAINTWKIPRARQKVPTHSFIGTPVRIFCAGDLSGQLQWDLLPFQLEQMRCPQAYTLLFWPARHAFLRVFACGRPDQTLPPLDGSSSPQNRLQVLTQQSPQILWWNSEMLLTDGGPNHVWFGDPNWCKCSTGVRSQWYKSVGVVDTIPIIQNSYNQIKTKKE